MPPTSASPTVTNLPPGAIANIKLSDIVASPFNPRRHFDDTGLAELAGSIKVQGLLENLIVRAGKKPGTYELMGGERRLRALRLNKAESAACQVLKADDAEAHAIQIVENLQRENLRPLEEAEAFAALQDQDPKKWTVEAIAATVGKTDRFVQYRLLIARNLEKNLKKRLNEGRLTVEMARLLAAVPADMQGTIATNDWNMTSAESVSTAIFRLVIPETLAAFDIAKYKGGFFENKGKRFFADPSQFRRLQLAEAQSRLEKLRGTWPKAAIIESTKLQDWAWSDTGDRCGMYTTRVHGEAKPGKIPVEKQHAIVWIDDKGALHQALGVVLATSIAEPRSSNAYSTPTEKPEVRRHRQACLKVVRAAAAAKPDMALRILLMRFIDGTTRATYDHATMKAAHAEILPPAALPFASSLGTGRDEQLWAVLKKMKPGDVTTAVAKYTALSIDWSSRAKAMPAFVGVLAKEFQVKLPAREKPKAKPAAKAKPKPVAKKKAAAKKKHQ